MLNPNTVYFKTEAGVEEVKARALGLRAELRRLLILVDGKTPLNRLAVFVRGSEIDHMIAELEYQGLVTTRIGAPHAAGQPIAAPAISAAAIPLATSLPQATAPPSSTPAPAVAPGAYANLEPTAAQMLAVRRTGVRTLHDLLGADADVLVVKIDRCKDAQELRVAITEIRQTLARQLGAHAGQSFLDAVRTAAEDTR